MFEAWAKESSRRAPSVWSRCHPPTHRLYHTADANAALPPDLHGQVIWHVYEVSLGYKRKSIMQIEASLSADRRVIKEALSALDACITSLLFSPTQDCEVNKCLLPIATSLIYRDIYYRKARVEPPTIASISPRHPSLGIHRHHGFLPPGERSRAVAASTSRPTFSSSSTSTNTRFTAK